MQKFKEKLKKIWEDHKAGIMTATASLSALALWLLYVNRNTIDFPKPDISEGICVQFYEQFGGKVMDGSVSLRGLKAFADQLSSFGFSEDTEVFFEIAENV